MPEAPELNPGKDQQTEEEIAKMEGKRLGLDEEAGGAGEVRCLQSAQQPCCGQASVADWP